MLLHIGIRCSRPARPGPARPCSPSAARSAARSWPGPQPRLGRKPAQWTAVDRDDETLRVGMQALFADLDMTTSSAAA